MGIRFHCPHCQNRLHVKSFLAGKRGVCPKCGASVDIPLENALPEEPAVNDAQPQDFGESVTVKEAAQRKSVGTGTATIEAKPRPQSPEIRSPETPASAKPAAAPAVPAMPSAAVAPADPAAPDANPFEPSADHVWYVRPPSGGEYGPARGDVMQRWVAEGRITPDSYVWRDGWPEWRLASDVLPRVAAAAAPSAPAQPAPALATAAPQIVPAPAIPSSAAASVLRYQKKKRERRGIWTAAVIVLSILAVVLIVMLVIVLRRGG